MSTPTTDIERAGAGPGARAPIGLAPGVPREAAGQDAAKYGSSNPVVRRLLDRWSGRLREVAGPMSGTVVDVGVGEGLCLERLVGRAAATTATGADGRARSVESEPMADIETRLVGVEYRFDKATVARRLPPLDVVVGDAGMLPFPDDAADLVLCIEVLEHLPTVAPAVAELARVCGGRCVVSVPWEPWFRLGNLGRGKNVRRFGNDPEHVHAFNPRRLRRALEQAFDQVRVVPAFPWLIAEGRPRH
ncbi:MAG: class I SAM-dependent methyltransferase [Acidimicrobiales bacterium]